MGISHHGSVLVFIQSSYTAVPGHVVYVASLSSLTLSSLILGSESLEPVKSHWAQLNSQRLRNSFTIFWDIMKQ